MANMSVRQNAQDHALVYPLAAKVVEDSFYVDDGLTGADSIEEAIELHAQLQTLFDKGGFLLRKWNSSEFAVLQHIEPELQDQQSIRNISDHDEYTKTLGVEWNAKFDHFRLTVADLLNTAGPSVLSPRTLRRRLMSLVGLPLSSSRQRFFSSTSGRKDLGRHCTAPTGASMAGVEARALSACGQAHSTLLLPEDREDRLQTTPRFL